MSLKALKIASALLVTSALAIVPLAGAAQAGGLSHVTTPSKAGCAPVKPSCGGNCGGGGVTINKPVTINKNVNIYKPVTIDKSVNIYKPVTIDKSIVINKTIDNSKNININKTIIINKGGGGGGSADASAWASAWAQASASASASANASASVGNITIYSGYNEYITVNNHVGGGGDIGVATNVNVSPTCEMADATVIKALRAVCIAPDGREFPASHMTEQTWIDSGDEGEVLRCIPGSHLKITMGDVLQSDQGMAGSFASGRMLECSPFEALRHYKDGMLKCAPKVWVKDCTERANLRRWGTGDMFFSFRTQVCAPKTAAAAVSREIELTGMSMTGGVGDQ